MREELIRIEVERIMNLVRGFGWEKVSEETAEGEVRITFKKAITVTQEPAK